MATTIDDELLALAGGLSDDDDRRQDAAATSAPSRKTKSSSSSSAPRKKRRLQDGGDDDEEDDDEDDEQDGMTSYPVEGVYKSLQDKQNIESLPLIERESILAQRRDEILSRERTAQLAGMVAAQQGRSKGKRAPKTATSRSKGGKKAKAADSDMDQSDDDDDDEDDEDDEEEDESDEATTTRSTRKVKSVGSSDTRNAKLQELSENRRKKAAGRQNRRSSPSSPRKNAQRGGSSDSSDSESDESAGYVESDDDARNRRRKGAAGSRYSRFDDGPFVAPDLEDINRARIGRDDILKIMYRKGWQDKLIGSFVRIVVDPIKDHTTGKMIPRYRAYEIVDWKKGSKWYAVDQGTFTQIHLILAFGKEKHTREIKFVSNSKITPEEFQRYNAQANESSRRPSKQNVIDQADDFADFLNEPWTEDTLTQVIKAKKDARLAAEDQQRNLATPTSGTAATTNGQSTPQQKSEDVLLAELNQRNRIADRQRIQDANKRQAEIRRAAAVRQAQAQAKAAAAGSDSASASTSATAANGSTPRTETKAAPALHKATAEVEIDLGDF